MEIKVLLPPWVGYNRVYFTIFQSQGVEDTDFWVDFVAENSKKLQNGFGRKNQLSPQF